MRRLRNKSVTPPEPEHFSYVHPETGHRSTHIQYGPWIDLCVEHRMTMSLDVPYNFTAIAEDQLCQKLSPEWCIFEKEGSQTWTDTRLSLSDIVGFTRVLIAHARDGGFVSQEEADRRAKICASCFLNTLVSGCGSCAALSSVLTPGKSTNYDSQLQSCAVCKCYNRSQVHFKLTTLEANDTPQKQEAYPSFCWKKIGAENYVAD